MDQINYNFVNRTKQSLYSHNNISNYNRINQNKYGEYLKQSNKLNVKSVSIYNPNNPLVSEVNLKNTNNLVGNGIGKDVVEQITNYYSSYSTKNSSKNKYSYTKDDLVNQNSLKKNFQNKNYLAYLQKKRNTYNSKDKIIGNNNIQKVYTDINEYKYNNKNLYNNLRDEINNSYDNNKLINKLKSSKSTNDFFMEEEYVPDNINRNDIDNVHDISIEYNNAPIIQNQGINYDNFIMILMILIIYINILKLKI